MAEIVNNCDPSPPSDCVMAHKSYVLDPRDIKISATGDHTLLKSGPDEGEIICHTVAA